MYYSDYSYHSFISAIRVDICIEWYLQDGIIFLSRVFELPVFSLIHQQILINYTTSIDWPNMVSE